MFRRKPAPDLIREPAPDLIRGGYRFAAKNMRHARIPKACPDSNRTGHALVLRFRSSHHFAADSGANFGIKGALAISMLSSAVFGFEVPTRACCKLIGTSNPPH